MKRSRKSRTAAKGVGIVALIAFLIGMYTGIPGFGGGEGVQGNVPRDQTKAAPIEDADDESQTGLEDDVVTVLIDGRSYSVLTSSDGQQEYRATSIEEVARLATAAKGDESGVRVKVLRRESARASAEEKLQVALSQAGVPESSVYWQKQFTP